MDLDDPRQQYAPGSGLPRRRRQGRADGALHHGGAAREVSTRRDLWQWLANYEKTTGGEILAIAHNGNLSNGLMFPIKEEYDGKQLDVDYVNQRARWEPLYEATQIKGDGETHPFLSPNDEFADYETWDIGNLDVSRPRPMRCWQANMPGRPSSAAWSSRRKLGTNPYKFGMIGSTDSHTSLATAEENNFFGKHSGAEPSPGRMMHPFMKNETGTIMGWQMVASGLAAVWAKENTREALFDAMERKEVYATTGTRLARALLRRLGLHADGHQQPGTRLCRLRPGVPMGGDLPPNKAGAKAPSFMVYALRDPIGGNLDRIQIIKGWYDGKQQHEKVYDVAWSGDRKPAKDGKVPAVGNTVDAKTASWTNTIGASELGTVWEDPDFDPKQRAFYYARVLEIPTPRWSTYDAFRFNVPIPEGAPVSTQERAYTSPIWYTPR